jgi:hypothetical protein
VVPVLSPMRAPFRTSGLTQLLAALAVSVLPWLPACSSKAPTPPKLVLSNSCSSDAECASQNFVCDLQRRECVCTSDAMCKDATTPLCNVFTGHCVAKLPGCTANSCAKGQFCDDATRTCRDERKYCESCGQDAECGVGNKCITHPEYPNSQPFCASACDATGACGAGQACKNTAAMVKQCVPQGSLCGGDQVCTPDAFVPCEADAQCAQYPGQRCDATLQRCVAQTNVCALGQSCDPRTQRCVAACDSDTACQTRYGAGFICLQRACRPANECMSDSQCAKNQFCQIQAGDTSGLGKCQPSCQQDSDCPLGRHCGMDAATGRTSCSSGCSSNTDCQLDEVCSAAGVCEAGHCQVKAVCGFAESCINNVCVKQPDNCASCSSACPGNGSCLPVNFNQACDNTTCPNGAKKACVSDPGSPCSGLTCFCQINRCLAVCGSDADCPHGFTCTQLPGGAFCDPVDDGQYCLTPP